MPDSVVVLAFDSTDPEYVLCLIKRRPESCAGKVMFPGGKIEAGESPLNAACREMLEETGLEISPWRLEHVASLCKMHPGCNYLQNLIDDRVFVYKTSIPIDGAMSLTDEPVFKRSIGDLRANTPHLLSSARVLLELAVDDTFSRPVNLRIRAGKF